MSRLNIGNLDRAVRILGGLVLIGLTLGGTVGPWGWLGVVALLTGLVAYCPLYAALGLATTSR